MDEFIGVNGFIDDPVDRLAAFGLLREYHQWQWDEGNDDTSYQGDPSREFAWSPSWVSGPGWGWDFDQFYRDLRERGVEVVPCLQGSARYIHNHVEGKTNNKPVTPDEDSTDAESYKEHAEYLFQFAARYGSRKVADELLQLREGQTRLSGLGMIRYLENWNEPDRWWMEPEAYFSPFELAAMCRADRDGHRGTMGSGIGIHAADPGMKFVLGGLALPHLEYLRYAGVGEIPA